jgi:hypothetical protein
VQIVTCTGSEFVLLASDLTALDNRSIRMNHILSTPINNVDAMGIPLRCVTIGFETLRRGGIWIRVPPPGDAQSIDHVISLSISLMNNLRTGQDRLELVISTRL